MVLMVRIVVMMGAKYDDICLLGPWRVIYTHIWYLISGTGTHPRQPHQEVQNIWQWLQGSVNWYEIHVCENIPFYLLYDMINFIFRWLKCWWRRENHTRVAHRWTRNAIRFFHNFERLQNIKFQKPPFLTDILLHSGNLLAASTLPSSPLLW